MAEDAAKMDALPTFFHTRRGRVWTLVAVGIALLVAAALLRSVTTPILVSLVIAYVMDPVVMLLERLRIRRWMAVTIVYLALLGALTLVLVTVVPPLYGQASKLPAFVDHLAGQLKLPAPVEGGPSLRRRRRPKQLSRRRGRLNPLPLPPGHSPPSRRQRRRRPRPQRRPRTRSCRPTCCRRPWPRCDRTWTR